MFIRVIAIAVVTLALCQVDSSSWVPYLTMLVPWILVDHFIVALVGVGTALGPSVTFGPSGGVGGGRVFVIVSMPWSILPFTLM